ncbi:Carboxy-terminal kinesin 2 [Phytophthora citrophthora]|uniref:Kinesin-like protein n=1 Tax=Phytophthora citrophthora TaxID=4793 RepID=A0AAD9GUV5_9STRA|nr:Carboxy-terminal kinesin 2 [Phytophthora citrophthora]
MMGLRSGSTSGRRSFDFDFIFPPWKRQRDVYDSCVEAQIRHVLQCHKQGQVQHATVVAYGQTGTGKTFTMGMLSDFNDEKAQGLIPRALSQVLEVAGSREETGWKTVVTLSFLQIYLETIQDLLAISGSNSRSKSNTRRTNNDLSVRQGQDGAFYVSDLNEYEISSIQDAHALLELAVRNRVLAATAKNKTSSRSHTLLTISLKRRLRSRYSSSEDDSDHDESDSDEEVKQASTISFVDLAGSERVDGALHFLRATRTKQEQRIREAKFINRSLSALGGVIAALAQPKPSGSASTSANVLARLQEKRQHSVENEQGQPHIRFRDSQLTKLLQGRLMNGRGRLLLIATVDDQSKNLSETLSTLKFAAQCRRVELQRGAKGREDRNSLRRQKSLLDQVFNDMKIMHENREAALNSEYQARIGDLERELEAARAALQSPTQEGVSSVHVASYTALCSLVDTVRNDNCKHPNAIDFESEKGMLDYVAGLYSRLKEALATQHHPLSSRGRPAGDAVAIDNRRIEPEGTSTRKKERKSSASVQTTIPANNIRAHRHVPLSAEQEAEFRAVARHLIASHALDSFVVSSSDEDE